MKSSRLEIRFRAAPGRAHTPRVTVLSRPNGFPTAMANSPTFRREESPSSATGSLPTAGSAERRRPSGRPRDHLRPVLAPIRKPHHDLVRVADDVLVGDDQPVFPDDDPRPEGVLTEPAVLLEQVQEILRGLSVGPPDPVAPRAKRVTVRILTTAGRSARRRRRAPAGPSDGWTAPGRSPASAGARGEDREEEKDGRYSPQYELRAAGYPAVGKTGAQQEVRRSRRRRGAPHSARMHSLGTPAVGRTGGTVRPASRVPVPAGPYLLIGAMRQPRRPRIRDILLDLAHQFLTLLNFRSSRMRSRKRTVISCP